MSADMTARLRAMYETPGVYLILMWRAAVFVEVDSEKVCHQLTTDTYKKDGVLSFEGWAPHTIQLIHGPLPFKEDR